MSSIKNYVEFFNGQRMPIVGLGTWQAPPDVVQQALEAAIDAGYRHVDTAYFYQNEQGVGNAIKKKIEEGVIKREDIFVTTKLPPIANRRKHVLKFLLKSLKALQLDYVDLYLIHLPMTMPYRSDDELLPRDENGKVVLEKTDYEDLWRGMEQMVNDGLTKSIGISNFNSEQIKKILNCAKIKPANLQVELHGYLQQKPLREFCREHGITVVAYSPIGSPGSDVFVASLNIMTVSDMPRLLDDPVVNSIAQKLNKTPAQILLRFLIQQEVVVIPKSNNPDRLRQNFQIFDFELSPTDMKALEDIDKNQRYFHQDFATTDHPDYPFSIPY